MIDQSLAAEISQLHEGFLTELEGLAIEAIATNDWAEFYAHVVDFQNEHELHGEAFIAIGDDEPSDSQFEANTDRLDNSGVGFVQNAQND